MPFRDIRNHLGWIDCSWVLTNIHVLFVAVDLWYYCSFWFLWANFCLCWLLFLHIHSNLLVFVVGVCWYLLVFVGVVGVCWTLLVFIRIVGVFWCMLVLIGASSFMFIHIFSCWSMFLFVCLCFFIFVQVRSSFSKVILAKSYSFMFNSFSIKNVYIQPVN